MPDKYIYLVIDIGAIIVPFLFSFHPKINFHKQWHAFWPANLLTTLIFLIWDAVYTKLGVWGFNDRYIIGYRLLGLPLEEILFFTCIPYSSIFTYYCFTQFFPSSLKKLQKPISVTLIIFLAILGVLNITRLYTGVTFIALASLIFTFSFFKKQHWLNTFYLMYLVILLPFFIVNGTLTGTGIDQPIVWYNDDENIGIRILTIPIEDIFYGMLLLLLNTAFFERFRTKNA
ncbi:MAG: lycopene cyclase domain-containing protein [Bacteroidetes bacterium]|nr:lycopene cyclase domain-containing protein [Bacteroidota bacterium]